MFPVLFYSLDGSRSIGCATNLSDALELFKKDGMINEGWKESDWQDIKADIELRIRLNVGVV